MNNENLTADTNSGQGTKEVADYITVRDKQGYEYKIINFDNPKYAPFDGLVELIPLKRGKGLPNQTTGIPALRHKNHISWTFVKDKVNDMYIGIQNGFDNKTGELRFDKIVLEETVTLNLASKRERMKYICTILGPYFVDSPNFSPSSRTSYTVVDKQKEAKEFVMNRRTKKKASEIAESLWGEELSEMAILLGRDPKLMSPEQLSMEVIKFAEDDRKINGKTGSERFMEAYNSDTKNELLIFKRGLSTGIITESEQGYMFNGLPLGFTEAESVHYLKEHPATSVSIDTQAKGKYTHNSTATIAKKEPVMDANAAEIANLKKALKEKEDLLKKLSSDAMESKSLNDVADKDAEYAEMLAECVQLGIKGGHMVGRGKSLDERKELLRKKIDEFKSTLKN